MDELNSKTTAMTQPQDAYWLSTPACRIDDFVHELKASVQATHCPRAADMVRGVPVYDCAAVRRWAAVPESRVAVMAEWGRAMLTGPGLVVLKGAFTGSELDAVDAVSAVFQQIIDDQKAGKLHGDIIGVFANHPDLEPLAKAAGLPFKWHSAEDPEKHFDWLLKELQAAGTDLVVLARYMRILPTRIVQAYRHRIINIHPSLLPYFPGAAPYKQAYESGVRVHGCTAHFVTEQLDEGPVILQDVFHINVGMDTLEDVKSKGIDLESQVLSKAVKLFLDEELVVVEGHVIFKPGISRFMREKQAVGGRQ